MRKSIAAVSFLTLVCMCVHAYAQEEWWQKWDNYPKVPKITASQVKQYMLSGEKIIFVYAGYEVDQVVCGSLYIPYTKVPPSGDGSTVTIPVPKNYWIMCYCP